VPILLIRHANRPCCSIADGVARGRHGWMAVDMSGGCAVDDQRHSTRVVIVPVAQHQGVCRVKGDAEFARVAGERRSLTRVEQQPPARDLDPDREAVLRQETVIRLGVSTKMVILGAPTRSLIASCPPSYGFASVPRDH